MECNVEIIIVNWNTCELLDQCINSVLTICNNGKYNVKITVVDNASIDNSLTMIREKYPHVKLIANNENLGFAKANNIAINQSDAEFLLLLNSDTIVTMDVITPVIEHFDRKKEVAIVGCKLLLKDGNRQVGDAGFEPTITTCFNYSFFLSKLFPTIFKGYFHNGKCNSSYIEVDWVSGAALFARRDFVKKCGTLTEDFFMYAEDMEWGLRAKKNGWSVHYLPNVSVHHLMGASSKNDGISTLSLECLKKVIRKKHSSLYTSIFWVIMFSGYMLRYFCRTFSKSTSYSEKMKRMMKAYMKKSFRLIFEVE